MSDELVRPTVAQQMDALRAELDAVRAERDQFKLWADDRHAAALLAEENYTRYSDAQDALDRAEATLAAIRSQIEDILVQAVPRPLGGQHAGAQKYQMTISTAKEIRRVLALLDAAAKKDTPMSERLTVEREAEIAATVRGNQQTADVYRWVRDVQALGDLLAELDAVRAERDAVATMMQQTMRDMMSERFKAERAEATLAAIRAWAEQAWSSQHDAGYFNAANLVLALLDAAPITNRTTPDELVNAEQDRVHSESGISRPARSVKLAAAPKETP